MKSKSLKENKLYLPAPPACASHAGGRPNTFYVYAIACNGESYYIGHTDDLRQRWDEHLSGVGADWTKRYKPIRIAHFEEYGTRKEAIAREKELKTGFGRKWLRREIKAGRLPVRRTQTGTRQADGLTPEEIKIIENSVNK